MKNYSFLILNGDFRQLALYNYLKDNGCLCIYYDYSDLCLSKLTKVCKVIVCPTPFTKNNSTIYQTDSIKPPVMIDGFLEALSSDNIVIGYGFPADFKNYCKSKSIKYFDLTGNLSFMSANSLLTAEGLIGNIITSTPFSLNKANCLITGFGGCGFHTADLLFKLGAYITILDIDNDKLNKAASLGYSVFKSLNDCPLSTYDLIINTVPENIFTKKTASDISCNCYIFDIASAPFGFDNALWEDLNHSVRLPSIPAKLMSKSAGELMGRTIIKILNDFERE